MTTDSAAKNKLRSIDVFKTNFSRKQQMHERNSTHIKNNKQFPKRITPTENAEAVEVPIILSVNAKSLGTYETLFHAKSITPKNRF